jgi:hypothetical protein
MEELLEPKSFAKILKRDIEEIQTTEKKFGEKSDALAFWYGTRILKLPEEDARKACSFQGGGRTGGEWGIDFFHVDKGRKRIIILQSECSEDLDPNHVFQKPSCVQKLRSALSALNSGQVGRNERIRDAVDAYSEYYSKKKSDKKKFSVDLVALISGKAGRRLIKEKDSFLHDLRKNYPKHEVRIVDFCSLLEEYCKALWQDLPPDFTLRIHPSKSQFKDDAIVVHIPAEEIHRLVKRYKLSLFERNARVPLLKKKVNEAIARQLENSESRKKIWYLNNGLTITCEDFKVVKGKVRIQKGQIVNGCQTAWTISQYTGSLDDTWVLAKIIKAKNSKFENEIRLSTNYQNEILPRDLRSNDPVQLRLQQAFALMGYYYERKRDEWRIRKELRPGIKNEYPKGNLDNERIGKCFLAWIGKPNEAKEEKREIFGKYYQEIFPKERSPYELLLPWLVRAYLYKYHEIGRREQPRKKFILHYVRTRGDLTVLALTGKILERKYLKGSKKTRNIKLLVDRFEKPEDHREFFENFDSAVNLLVKSLQDWARKRKKIVEKQEGAWDSRELHRNYGEILEHPNVRRAIRESMHSLPRL